MNLIDREALMFSLVFSDETGSIPCGQMKAILEVVKALPLAQPKIIHCRDCNYWIPGFISDNDDFIPPKCGKYQQMVGHSEDDYCSYAERREVSG